MRSLRLVGVLEWSFKTRLYLCRGGIGSVSVATLMVVGEANHSMTNA